MADHTPSKYHYDPSLNAAIIFAAFFAISGIVHCYQLIKNKAWFFVPFFIGVLFEVGGYAARAINANQTPDWASGPFIAQTLLILLGPALFAASIYMILGRMIRLLCAEHLSPIKTKWMTKIFVFGDLLSFTAQAIGGAMVANADSEDGLDKGRNIVLVGLAIQIVFFGVFMGVLSFFHYRIVRQPTTISTETDLPWKRHIFILYTTSILIMIRSLFRVAEFAVDQSSPLKTSEVYIYCLDAALMLICTVIFNIQHPSRVIKKIQVKDLTSHMELGSA